MKKLNTLFSLLLISFLMLSCGTKNIHKMQGDKKIDTGIEARKYQDVPGETYYVIVLGEHGDEMIARRYAIANAAIEFGKKAQTMITALYESESSQTLKDKVGKLNNEEQASALSKASANDMILEEDQLYYNEDQGGLYKYRAVYKVEFDNIIRFLNESL
jgi:hypothetical protein